MAILNPQVGMRVRVTDKADPNFRRRGTIQSLGDCMGRMDVVWVWLDGKRKYSTNVYTKRRQWHIGIGEQIVTRKQSLSRVHKGEHGC